MRNSTISPMNDGPQTELDIEQASRRLADAAEAAKRLEEAGQGFEAHAAWDRYLGIKRAIEAQERSARAARRLAATQ